MGEDGSQMTKDVRLTSAANALHAADNTLDRVSTRLRIRAEPLQQLGATLARLSRLPHPSLPSPTRGVLAACEDRLAVVPTTELGGFTAPRLSLVVRTSRGEDVQGLAKALREANSAMPNVSTETILLDDGTLPLARLLPSRLRNLRLVQSPPESPPGVGLNAAALSAKGAWLAFARPGALAAAHLLETVRDAVEGTFYIEAPVADPRAVIRYHRLHGLVMRKAFHEMGGFDPLLEEPELWTDLLDKACMLDLQVMRWKYPSESAIHEARAARTRHG